MKISEEFDQIVGFAREEAMRTGSYSIGADHLLLGLLRHGSNDAVKAMKDCGMDTCACKKELDSRIFHEHSIPYEHEDEVRLNREGSNTVSLAIAEAMKDGAPEAGAIHLLKAISRQEGCWSGESLRRAGIRFSPAGRQEKPSQAQPSPEQITRLLSTIRISTKNPS